MLLELYGRTMVKLSKEEENWWGKMSSPGCDPPPRRMWCLFYRLSELPFCPWPEGRMAQTRGTRQASATVPLPSPVSAHQLPKLSSFSIGNRPQTWLPSARFPHLAESAPRVLRPGNLLAGHDCHLRSGSGQEIWIRITAGKLQHP